MASPGTTATVTIDRVYFETLVRRARLNVDDATGPTATPVQTVTIPKTEYHDLEVTARQHENLRRNLLGGGVNLETLNYLCSNDAPTEDTQRPVPSTVGQPESTVGGALLNQPSFRHRAHTPTAHTPTGFTSSLQDMGYTHAGVHAQYSSHKGWAEAGDEGESGNDLADTLQEQTAEGLPPQKPQYERLATRTIMLSNLAEGITHADIIAVVRGGQVLEVFLRNHDHSATLSFVQAADAKNFYDYARRYDVYIKNKRVEFKWSDRQFILPGHVAHQIGNGATRNLVIRRCDSSHTEESIREDLEHIHNLAVLGVDFNSGNCFIKTNSVHNAMYARTCMMSRLKFKNCKIEWDLDECAQPLDRVISFRAAKEAPAPKSQPLNPRANRFQLLNLDDEDSDSEPELFRRGNTMSIAA